MDWAQGYSASYYGYYVDPVSWRDIERFEIVDGNIERTDEELRQSASVTLTDFEQGEERWVRIYLDTKQNESGAHVALFTGIGVTPDKGINGSNTSYSLDCYSVLKPAQDVLLQRGWYAPVETSSGLIIQQLLDGFAPVVVDDNSPLLSNAIIAEEGETCLTMADKILDAINWMIRIDGDGTINVIPRPTDAVATFDPHTNDMIEPEITYTHDWFNCPNCFRAVSDDLVSVAKDESGGLLSIQGRGREVWMEEDGVDLSDNESIAEYATRKLKEEQQVATMVTYNRRYDPDINVGDMVNLHYTEHGIDGVFTISNQSIELGYGARVTEEVKA